MKKECVDFYLWMQKKGYDHNIKTRIENKYNEYELEQLTPTAVVQVKPEVCQNVIHHTCKWFDQYNGCMGCLVKKYEGKLSS